ncbi:MAG: microcystin-dependent protein [Phycisphaerales bacterium]|jgi:microcystin-dependent protein
MPAEPYIGEIAMFAGNFAPRNWAFCDGALLSIASNDALFSILGTTYGGDGRTTFGLPDLRGRVPVSPGQGPGLSNYTLGQKTGVENVVLTAAQMPNHTHSVNTIVTANASPAEGDSASPGGKVWAKSGQGDPDYAAYDAATAAAMAPEAVSASTTLDPAGGNAGHTNVQPVLGIYYIIALVGIFPTRP